ncbi:MAG: hypothetical protein LBB65_04535 [Burkholderiales bacterium]|nr:hypothetical protein [Burkholderiales bacterium]
MNIQTPLKNVIYFIFDAEAAKKLLTIFAEKSGAISSEHPQIREISFQEAEDDYIKIIGRKNRKVILSLSAETFEHGIWMIEYYLLNSYFNVAEFCEFEVISDQQNHRAASTNPENRRTIQIYFFHEAP